MKQSLRNESLPVRSKQSMRAAWILAFAVALTPTLAAHADERSAPTVQERSESVRLLFGGPDDHLRRVLAAGPVFGEMRLTPVASHPGGSYNTNGYYTAANISGQRLTVYGPGRTYWELTLSNWGGGGNALGRYQGALDADSLLGANADCGAGPCISAGDLSLGAESCVSAADCTTVYGAPGEVCAMTLCDGAFVDVARADWVLSNAVGSVQGICSTAGIDPTCGGVSDDNEPRTDDGSTYYGATFVIDVPVDTIGTYSLKWDVLPATFWSDENLATMQFATLTGGELDVKPPVPATSDWGLITLALTVLAAGTIAMRRRTHHSAPYPA